jgi:hypothetical protein
MRMDRIKYRDQLESLKRSRGKVAQCGPFRDTAQASDDFEAFSAADYGRRVRLHPEVAWDDACSAYALALVSYEAHEGTLDLTTEHELEVQWDELRGPAEVSWPVVRTMVREAWRWLDDHRPVQTRPSQTRH